MKDKKENKLNDVLLALGFTGLVYFGFRYLFGWEFSIFSFLGTFIGAYFGILMFKSEKKKK